MSAAPSLPQEFIDQIRERTPLAALVGRTVRLVRSGRQWKGCCPFHSEKTPSFYVYEDGHYHCFGCGAHGDAIKFVMQQTGASFMEAMERLANEAGFDVPKPEQQPATPEQRAARAQRAEQLEQNRKERAADRERQRANDEQERIEKARTFIAGTVDWRGTPGWTNWHLTRGLAGSPEAWGKTLRWHPGQHALVAIATLPDGTEEACHLTYVTRDGQNAKRPDGKNRKITHGVRTREQIITAVVRLPGDASKPLVIGEGPENTGVGALALQAEGWAALGNITGLEPPAGRLVVVEGDGDRPESDAAKRLTEWVDHWRGQGRWIAVAMPTPAWTGKKFDFNDLLLKHGLDAARERFALAVEEEHARQRAATLPATGLAPADPPFSPPTATPTQVRSVTTSAIVHWFADHENTPHTLLTGPTGSGKTDEIGKLLPHVTLVDKARWRPHRTAVLVPTHHLGSQIASRYSGKGGSVATFEGRGDPWRPAPEGRTYPCQNLEEVGLAIIAGEDVGKKVCGSLTGKNRCRFRKQCSYYQQFERAAAADTIIAANTFVFDALPPPLCEKLARVIIDEDFTHHGLQIRDLDVDTFSAGSVQAFPVLVGDAIDREASLSLIRLFGRVGHACTLSPDQLTAEDLSRANLTADDIAEARELNWRRKQKTGMWPGMPLDDRKEAARRCRINRSLPRIADALHAMEAMLTNEGQRDVITLSVEVLKSGTHRVMMVHGLRRPHEWVTNRPVLICDATARPDKVTRFFPSLRHVAPPAPRLEHQIVHQRLGTFGKSAMRDEKKLAAMVDEVTLRTLGRTALVLVHKEFENAFKHLPNVTVRHHGDTAGDDDNGDVDVVIQIGGPFARPQEIAEAATAETGRLVTPAKLVRTPCAALMMDGTGIQFERMAYEDPAAQAVHTGIYDASFVQGGLGRGRGINRSASTPLEVWIYGNLPLPVPVTTLRRWQPDLLGQMILAGGVHSNAQDRARFHPSIFKTHEASAKWQKRHVSDLESDARVILDRDPRPHVKVTWQPAGQGHKSRWSVVPADDVEIYEGAALGEFGGLVTWRVEPFTDGCSRPEASTPEESAKLFNYSL